MEPGRWSRGRDWGEGESMKESLPLTLCTYVRIPMPISTSYMGKGGGERAGRKLSAVCIVCHYHYELHYDVRL